MAEEQRLNPSEAYMYLAGTPTLLLSVRTKIMLLCHRAAVVKCSPRQSVVQTILHGHNYVKGKTRGTRTKLCTHGISPPEAQ